MTRDLPIEDDDPGAGDHAGDAAYRVATGVARVARAGAYVTGGALIASNGSPAPTNESHTSRITGLVPNDPQPDAPSPVVTYPDPDPDSVPPPALGGTAPAAPAAPAPHQWAPPPDGGFGLSTPDGSFNGGGYWYSVPTGDGYSPSVTSGGSGRQAPGSGQSTMPDYGDSGSVPFGSLSDPGFGLPGLPGFSDDGFDLPGYLTHPTSSTVGDVASSGHVLPDDEGGHWFGPFDAHPHPAGSFGHGLGLPGTGSLNLPGMNGLGANGFGLPDGTDPGHAFDGIGDGDMFGVFFDTQATLDAHIGLDGIWVTGSAQLDIVVGDVGHQLDHYGDWLGNTSTTSADDGDLAALAAQAPGTSSAPNLAGTATDSAPTEPHGATGGAPITGIHGADTLSANTIGAHTVGPMDPQPADPHGMQDAVPLRTQPVGAQSADPSGAQSVGAHGVQGADPLGAQSVGGHGVQGVGAVGAQSVGAQGAGSVGVQGVGAHGVQGVGPVGVPGVGGASAGDSQGGQGVESAGVNDVGGQGVGGVGVQPGGSGGSQAAGSGVPGVGSGGQAGGLVGGAPAVGGAPVPVAVSAVGVPAPLAAAAPAPMAAAAPVSNIAVAQPISTAPAPIAAPPAPVPPPAPVVAQPVAVTPLQNTVQPEVAAHPVGNVLFAHPGSVPLTVPVVAGPSLSDRGSDHAGHPGSARPQGDSPSSTPTQALTGNATPSTLPHVGLTTPGGTSPHSTDPSAPSLPIFGPGRSTTVAPTTEPTTTKPDPSTPDSTTRPGTSPSGTRDTDPTSVTPTVTPPRDTDSDQPGGVHRPTPSDSVEPTATLPAHEGPSREPTLPSHEPTGSDPTTMPSHAPTVPSISKPVQPDLGDSGGAATHTQPMTQPQTVKPPTTIDPVPGGVHPVKPVSYQADSADATAWPVGLSAADHHALSGPRRAGPAGGGLANPVVHTVTAPPLMRWPARPPW
ncbi:hypothetical protein, partial [Nocardia wallacei]|uniref:hypothetical protein n=1 Tax=Nocardia wallacei TaxID=480035 RepID=UPI002457AD8F